MDSVRFRKDERKAAEPSFLAVAMFSCGFVYPEILEEARSKTLQQMSHPQLGEMVRKLYIMCLSNILSETIRYQHGNAAEGSVDVMDWAADIVEKAKVPASTQVRGFVRELMQTEMMIGRPSDENTSHFRSLFKYAMEDADFTLEQLVEVVEFMSFLFAVAICGDVSLSHDDALYTKDMALMLAEGLSESS